VAKTMQLGSNWQSLNVDEKRIKTSNVSVYPNPSSSLVNVLSNIDNASIASIEVFDIAGTRVLMNNVSASTSIQIDVRDFAAGLYIGEVSLSNGQKTIVKFSVQ